MELERNKLFNITAYIVCITFITVLTTIIYKLLLNLHYYYLFVTIPVLFLLVALNIWNITKLILTLVSLIFGRNDNEEINRFIKNAIINVNQTCKYVLIGIFTAMLSTVMILDIIICINSNELVLLSVSIVIWILLYYLLFRNIVKMIKKEIQL